MNKQNKNFNIATIQAFLQRAFKPAEAEVAAVVAVTGNDFRNATLIVSVFINAFILTTWLVVETAQRYVG